MYGFVKSMKNLSKIVALHYYAIRQFLVVFRAHARPGNFAAKAVQRTIRKGRKCC